VVASQPSDSRSDGSRASRKRSFGLFSCYSVHSRVRVHVPDVLGDDLVGVRLRVHVEQLLEARHHAGGPRADGHYLEPGHAAPSPPGGPHPITTGARGARADGRLAPRRPDLVLHRRHHRLRHFRSSNPTATVLNLHSTEK
jgi:hypothetical protein